MSRDASTHSARFQACPATIALVDEHITSRSMSVWQYCASNHRKMFCHWSDSLKKPIDEAARWVFRTSKRSRCIKVSSLLESRRQREKCLMNMFVFIGDAGGRLVQDSLRLGKLSTVHNFNT